MRLESKCEDLTEDLLGHVKDDGKPLKGDVLVCLFKDHSDCRE